MTAILLVTLLVCFGLGMPIAFSLGVASVTALQFGADLPLALAAQRLFTGTDSFPLMAVPFFMLAGELMECGGISRRLFDFAHALVGFVFGGLAMVAVVGAMFFAGISGAAAADTAAVGAVSIPAMIRKGYPQGFRRRRASGWRRHRRDYPAVDSDDHLRGGGGGFHRQTLHGRLHPGGPDRRRPDDRQLFLRQTRRLRARPFPRRAGNGACFGGAVWALLMPLIILGGILGGIFTPTEAAVVAVLYGAAIGLVVYRELRLRTCPGFLRAPRSPRPP